MKATEALGAACQSTGLDDFGADGFREGLDVYCDSVTEEAQLNDLGRIAVEAQVVGSLTNRLKVIDWFKRYPEIEGETIEAPVFVIGMFRAGTTLLSNLLDRDPTNRALLRWEAADSVPPPGPENFRVGPRVDAARDSSAVLDQINPKIPTVHFEAAEGPTECITLMAQDFKSLLWEAITNVPSYSDWLLAGDHTSAYEYHRIALQVLQSGGVRGRWTLKSPHHAIALEALTAVYPDARLVLLHRDPVALCGSVCSLIHTLSSTFSDADHRSYIAEHWTSMLETSAERIYSFRDAHPEHPVLDLDYNDLMSDPVNAVRRIYDFAGASLSEEAAKSIDAYGAENRQGKHGAHRYDLADYGLRAGEIRERFSAYTSRRPGCFT